MDFLIINGEVVSKNEAKLTSFLWNEPFILIQKVWFGFGGIPLFNENLRAIEEQFDTFHLRIPPLFRNKRELFRLTKRMLNKNKFYRSGFIKYQFFVSGNTINYLITSELFTDFDFPFQKQGLLVNISKVKKNSALNLGCYNWHNKILWEAAKASIKDSALQGSILLNECDRVCEGIAANIFMVKAKVLITPSIETGCYVDLLRPLILKFAALLKLKVIEVPEIKKEHLFEMDEMFFASEEHGVQWVLGVDKKRYVHENSEKIHTKLNSYLKKLATTVV